MDTRAIVETIIKLWAAQDVESAFEYVSEDVIYALHISEELAPFAGVARADGDAMKVAFYKMIEEYDYLKWEPLIMGIEGDVVRLQTQFSFHHRRTGADLEGSMRTILTMRDGFLVCCEEFLDRGLVEAFMRLAQHREATNQIVKGPEIPKRRPEQNAGVPVRMNDKVPDKEGC